jgi:hypothetical protein
VCKALAPGQAAAHLGPAARALARDLAKQSDPAARNHLARALAAVCKALAPGQAAAHLGPAARALARDLAKQSDPFARGVLARALAAVCEALPEGRAAAHLDPNAQALARVLAKQSSIAGRLDLALGLAAVAKALPADRAMPYLLSGLARYPGVQKQFFTSLSEVAGRSSLPDVVGGLKHPLCYGEARQLLLRRAEKLTGRQFRSRWELVDWLTTNHPEIDPSTPPRVPEDAER